MRIDLAVAVIEGQHLADLRQQGCSGFVQDERAGAGFDVEHVAIDQRIAPDLPQMLVEVIAEAQREAGTPFVIRFGAQIVGLDQEDVDAGDQVAIQEIRIGDGRVDRAAPLRQHAVDAGVDAGADQVALGQADIDQRAGIGRVTAAEGQLAGGFLVDRRRAGSPCPRREPGVGGDVDGLEIAQIGQPGAWTGGPLRR